MKGCKSHTNLSKATSAARMKAGHTLKLTKVTGDRNRSYPYEPWCEMLAEQYVKSVPGGTVEDSAAWLQRMIERATDPKEKRRILVCKPSHFYHYEWVKAVKDAMNAKRNSSSS